MFNGLLHQLKTACTLLIVLTLLTGLVYPLVITGIAQLFFPHKANGSLLIRDGKPVGSALIGQYFNRDNYFWGRPSATTPYPYNAANSTGSNYGPINPNLLTTVKDRVEKIIQSHPDNKIAVPVDLVTSSGSGLDPDISPLAAWYQVKRIANARHISDEQLQRLIIQYTKDNYFWSLGEPRVNVLALNLALDQL